MRFRVLTHLGSDAADWSALIARLRPDQKDIHFLPEYGDIYYRTYGLEPFLACLECGKNFIIQPFVRRPLNGLPFLSEQHVTELYYDISNPYGYGGPLCRCDSDEEAVELFRKFNDCFLDYCTNERLASEFASLHPLLHNQLFVAASGVVDTDVQKEVVYMDLMLDEAELWKGIRKGHKSSIKKAINNSVRIEKVVPTAANFDSFNRLYYETMERNSAAERWIFPENYFQNCLESLGENRVSLFFASHGDEIAAACILMHDFDTVYYHFSGSNSRHYNLCPNNLLVYEVALWARQMGYRFFHLGGGVTSSHDDSLYIFKSGFSGRTATLYTYCRILHEQTYDHLCGMKKNHEILTDGIETESDYFPLYRR